MAFDASKVPGGDVAVWGRDCREHAEIALLADDWRGVYDWTKSWVGWGGGAWLPDSWLLYAASALLKGEPRNAVHSLDLGLGMWIEGPADRALLTWCRGVLVWAVLRDPKTALSDLEAAAGSLPAWLGMDVGSQLQACRASAESSRKRVASVKPRPSLAIPASGRDFVAPQVDVHADGDEPTVWRWVARFFEAP